MRKVNQTFYVERGWAVADFGQNEPEAVLFSGYISDMGIDPTQVRIGSQVLCCQLSRMELQLAYADFVLNCAEKGGMRI